MVKKSPLDGVLGALLTTAPLVGQAAIVTVEFEGVVTGVNGNAASHIAAGDTFAGRFAFDGEEPPWITPGRYGLGMQEFSIQFSDSEGITYYEGTQSDGFTAFDIEVVNSAFDGFRAVATGLPEPPGDPFASRLQFDFTDQGTDHQGATFGSLDLPVPPPFELLTNRSGSWSLPNFLSIALLEITDVSVVVPPSPPEWVSISATGGGEIHLTLGTVPGERYLIEHSADGADWVGWQTLTASAPTTTLVDNPPIDTPVLLYRATRL